ncbi:MAG: hypothetical protein IT232_09255 [Flavobacteriales bacterium]|nr:hypothetical protein [Flavobacteriales bacterium]
MKVVRFLELMWLIIAIFNISVGIYKLFTMPEIDDAIFFFIFALIAVILYFIRRKQRINIQNSLK